MLRGDTVAAREKHAEAGKLLRRRASAAIKGSDRQHFRFLAATQFYKAGLYDRALELCRRIQPNQLPDHAKKLYPGFEREVRRREQPGYEQSIREQFVQYQRSNKYQEILGLLHLHPYVFDRQSTAFIRAHVTFKLGNYYASGIFLSFAHQYGLTEPAKVFAACCLPVGVLSEQGLEAAWAAGRDVAKGFQHPLADIVVSSFLYQLANSTAGNERREWARKHIEYYQSAMNKYEKQSEGFCADPEVRVFVAGTAATAAIASVWVGDLVVANEALQRAETVGAGYPVIAAVLPELRAFVKASATIDTPPTIPFNELIKDLRNRGEKEWIKQGSGQAA
jgi:hypothetical protein